MHIARIVGRNYLNDYASQLRSFVFFFLILYCKVSLFLSSIFGVLYVPCEEVLLIHQKYKKTLVIYKTVHIKSDYFVLGCK